MIEISAAALILPDGRLVMQRRRPGSDLLPGYLGWWGGKHNSDEVNKPKVALRREINKEETSLNITEAELDFVGDYKLEPPVSARDAFQFHFFRIRIPTSEFEVKEGASSEVYDLNELRGRTDIMPTVRFVLDNVAGFKDGA